MTTEETKYFNGPMLSKLGLLYHFKSLFPKKSAFQENLKFIGVVTVLLEESQPMDVGGGRTIACRRGKDGGGFGEGVEGVIKLAFELSFSYFFNSFF